MLNISYLNESTVADVARLEQECFGADAWSENLLRGEIGCDYKHYYLFYDGDNLVAYGGFMHIIDEAHVANVAVAADSRKRGYGTLLIEKIIEESKKLNIKAITLEVREGNAPARGLYEKCGFECVGLRKKYYHDGENACIYWKYL